MTEVRGRVAVVTGAASGIGLAVAEALAGEGTRLVLADRDAEALEVQRARLAAAGHDVHAVPTDVSDPDAVEALAQAAVARFGALHIAVNNAGIVNRGVTWELPLVAKHGVLGVSDVLRLDLARVGAPVGVSVVMPGMIRTGMNPVGTVSAEQVAANILDAIRRDRPYVFTDDHSRAEVEERLAKIVAARDDVLDQGGAT